MRTLALLLIVLQSFIFRAQKADDIRDPKLRTEPQIEITQNPGNTSFNLAYKNDQHISNLKVKVLDSEGQTILRKTFRPDNENFIITIQLGGNASGVYFIEISGYTDGTVSFMKTKRIVVN